MRPRPIRPQIYLPVVRFGVRDTDWKFVIAAVLLSYALPFFFQCESASFSAGNLDHDYQHGSLGRLF